ncbi:MAG TPA: hypothetical protein VN426_18145 [Syntrophomonadaceae bacterium]|nr:hypothetical protein [Syntrophomonadaceae bacterium]
MDELTLHEAVENISLIKSVIERTSKYFAAFSKIFIYWGMLFTLYSAISLLIYFNREQMIDLSLRYSLFDSYTLPLGLIALLAILVYRSVAKKIPLVGLERHLMKLWMLILVMNVIQPSIISKTIIVDPAITCIHLDTGSVMLFSFAIALIITSLFTGYKQLSNMGIIYIIISVLYAFFYSLIDGTVVQLFLSLIALPFTFLYTGFFLKSQQVRGN